MKPMEGSASAVQLPVMYLIITLLAMLLFDSLTLLEFYI